MKSSLEKFNYKKGIIAGAAGFLGAAATRFYKSRGHVAPEGDLITSNDILFMAAHKPQIERAAAALRAAFERMDVELDPKDIDTAAFIAVKQGDAGQPELRTDNGELQAQVSIEVDAVLEDEYLRQMISSMLEPVIDGDWDNPSGVSHITVSRF